MYGDDEAPSAAETFRADIGRKFQHFLDKSTVYVVSRWVGFLVAVLVYILRVYLINGWYIVTYGLGIYLLNGFIGFLSPQVDPESDGPVLPTSSSDGEFRPFSRRVPEFKFWYSSTKGIVVAFLMTFFSVFDVPVFWPILVSQHSFFLKKLLFSGHLLFRLVLHDHEETNKAHDQAQVRALLHRQEEVCGGLQRSRRRRAQTPQEKQQIIITS